MSVTFLTNEDEQKYVQSVNGSKPDESGNVQITIPNPDVSVTDEQIAQAVEDYLTEHPIEVPDSDDVDLSGYVQSVNGIVPDENGNVQITIPDSGGNVELDTTLTQSGKAADAKAVGDALANITVSAAAIDYDTNVKAVNHRGYCKVAPENTIPAYILSAKNGFKYVECDVMFTADGIPVLSHNNNIASTSNGTGTISTMTYAELLQYDFGSYKGVAYSGTKIATMEEFLMTCKALCLHPYIEFKAGSREAVAGVVELVRNMGMRGKVTYIDFSATRLEYVKEADPQARLGYLSSITESTIQTALGFKSDENEVFMDASLSSVTDEMVALCIENGLPLEVYTVNSENDILGMNRYITGVTSDTLIAGKILYEKYMNYSQTEYPATGITLDKNTLEFTEAVAQTLTATVEPTYTTDKVFWTSNNEGVATVSNGLVTPIANGSAVITARAGTYSASCAVTVNVSAEIVTYSITRNLTNCTSNNSATSISGNNTLSEIITPNTGYSLSGAVVSVTMGGVDITSSAYADGVINIANVSGDVVISVNVVSADSTLLYSWDFTNSLTDTVSGMTAQTTTDTTETGLVFDTNNEYIWLNPSADISMVGKTVEIDVVYSAFTGTQHSRIFAVNYGGTAPVANAKADAFICKNNKTWSYYAGAWNSDNDLDTKTYPADYFSGKTVRLSFHADEYKVDLYSANIGSSAFTYIKTFTGTDTTHLTGGLVIGDSANNSTNPCTISAVRIYDGVK